jgi:hypothetical protein
LFTAEKREEQESRGEERRGEECVTVCDEIFVFKCSSEGAKVFWRFSAAGGTTTIGHCCFLVLFVAVAAACDHKELQL